MKATTRIWTILLCISLLFLMQGCASKEEKVAKFITRGDRLMEKGDPMRAILEYKNALQLDPKSSNAQFAMGKALLAQKNYNSAYKVFNAVLEIDPKRDDARVEVAELLAGSQPQAALDELAKIGKPGGLETQIGIARALAFMSLKKFREAVEILSSLKGAEGVADAQMMLAVSLQQLGDTEGMEAAAARARSIDPKAPFPYVLVARFAAGRGDRARAVREMEALVDANPDPSVALLRGRVFEELGMMDEAEDAYAKLPDQSDMVQARAMFLLRRGKWHESRQVLEALLEKHPDDINAALGVVQILQEHGQTEAASERIEKSLKLDPKGPSREKLLVAKAFLKAVSNDTDGATQLCQEVLSQNQTNPQAHFLLGRILLDSGSTEEAEIHLNQAATALPNNPEAQILLARSQLLNKKDSLATDTLNNAVRANPNEDGLRLAYVRMLLARQDIDPAVKVLDQGIEGRPEDPTLIRTRGEIFASRKDFAKAERDFEKLVKLTPDSPEGCIEMGRLMLAQSKADKAIEWMKQALARKDKWESAIPFLAAAYNAKGDYQPAIALAEAETAQRPSSPLAFYLMGLVHAENGKLPEAEKAFSKAVELAPEWIDPKRAMASVYFKEGKIDTAMAEMEQMYQKRPSPSVAMSLAMFYEQKGRVEDATRLLNEVLEKFGQSPVVENDLAYLYAEYMTGSNELDKAAKLAAQALARQPKNAVFMDTAAWIAYKQGNFDTAWTRIQGALEVEPDIGPHNLHAAIIAKAKGQKDQAVYYLGKALQENLDQAAKKTALDLKKELDG
jgi:tetratricopeptide (TPR) repeat protein